VITDDCQLVILNPSDFHSELAVFSFPRVARKSNRCLADYFRSEGDVVAFQAVTIGRGLSERCRAYFQQESRYSDGFYLNGIGNYLTENIAERATREIQRGLSLDRTRGRRYSFGYPGMPGLGEQAGLFELMAIEERLGISLTPGFQMAPEHSTIGMFVHHPQADYF
jgi:5-methyltetrahydrofolate--homocysteine methyltransferase